MSEPAPQTADATIECDQALATALGRDLRLIARFHDRELDSATLDTLASLPVAQWFTLRLRGEVCVEACRLVSDALNGIADHTDRAMLDDYAAEYAAIYLTHSYRAAPTESVWRDEDGLERQGAMFATRKWYGHYGVVVPDWRLRSDDHIVHELEFLALLFESATDNARLTEAARFLRDHPLVWVPEFCKRVSRRCRLQLYAGFALLTLTYIEELAKFLHAVTGLEMTPPALRLSAMAPVPVPGTPTCADPPAMS